VVAKRQILKAIEELPAAAGVEDALDRLPLLYKVESGLGQADRGELISQEEVRQRMAKWLKYGGRRRAPRERGRS
jgi:predicted transcriptional regulator